jgi:hypothetical protein
MTNEKYRISFYCVEPNAKDTKTEEDLGKDGMSEKCRNRLDCLYDELKKINISGVTIDLFLPL